MEYENSLFDDYAFGGGLSYLPQYSAPQSMISGLNYLTEQPALTQGGLAAAAPMSVFGGASPMKAEPNFVAARDPSLNKFFMFPNQLADGTATVESTPFARGESGEAIDPSYFEGGVQGGAYLGSNQAIQPVYYLGQRFGKPVEDAVSLPSLTSGNQHRVTNTTTGEVLYEGFSPEGVVGALDKLTQGGNRNEWKIEQALNDQYSTVAKQEKQPDVAGDFLKIALPAALAFIPGVGPALAAKFGLKGLAAKAIGAGLASGIGRTAAGVLTGDPVLDSLKAGAISGLGSAATAGLLDKIGIDKALSNAFSGAKGALAEQGVSEGVGQGISEAAKKAAEEGLITVVGSRFAPTVLSGGLSAASGSLLGDVGKSLVQPDRFQQALDQARLDNRFGPEAAVPDPEIVVSNTTTPPGGLNAALSTGVDGALNLGTNTLTDVSLPGEDLIDILGNRIRPAGLSDLAPSLLSELPGAKPTVYDPNELVVTGQRVAPETTDRVDLLAPVASAFVVSNILNQQGESLEQEQSEKKSIGQKLADLSLLDKISLGGVALGGISSLLGDGARGGAGAGFTPGAGAAALGTASSLNPIFSAKLPTVGAGLGGGALGAGGGRSFAPRDMSDVDFARYGYGPAQSFFENVPRNPQEYRSALLAAPVPQAMYKPPGDELANYIRRMVPGATDAQIEAYMLNPATAAPAFAKGGASFASRAVKGPGTGRSDEIPALLSDGEYVIDAETVALLGDGSGKAGAKRLDEFRVSIRKHKGRKLAKGKFSANAKRPENYLVGGRA